MPCMDTALINPRSIGPHRGSQDRSPDHAQTTSARGLADADGEQPAELAERATMAAAGVFWGGGRADEVADFDEYDPTPYGGGYDIALTFGRPLPPSEETCYPISTATSSASSYDRPQQAQHGGRRPGGSEESHGSAAGYGGGGGYAGAGRPHQPHKEETHGYGRKGHDDDDEQQAYRKPKPAYGDDHEQQAYRKPKPSYGDDDDDQAYRKPKPSYGDEKPSYGRKKKVSVGRWALNS